MTIRDLHPADSGLCGDACVSDPAIAFSSLRADFHNPGGNPKAEPGTSAFDRPYMI
jgi:hypothetical protein